MIDLNNEEIFEEYDAVDEEVASEVAQESLLEKALNNLDNDTEASLQTISELAAKGMKLACFHMMHIYKEGKYLPQDDEKVFEYAVKGDGIAGCTEWMIEGYIDGKGTEKNVDKAIEICLSNLEAFRGKEDDPRVCNFVTQLNQYLSYIYYQVDGYVDYGKALSYGKYAAERGLFSSQERVASIYGNARYAGYDLKESNIWCRKALENSTIMPFGRMLVLASMVRNYLRMDPSDVDFDELFSLLDQIEEDKKEFYGISLLQGEEFYLRGEVYNRKSPADYENALKYYEQAFQHENSSQEVKGKAAYRLARCYYQGLGVKEDFDRCKEYIDFALECKNTDVWIEETFWDMEYDNPDWQKIIQNALDVLEVTMNIGSAYYALGMVYLQAPAPYEDFLKGSECIKKAIENRDKTIEYPVEMGMQVCDMYHALYIAYGYLEGGYKDYNKAYEYAKLLYEEDRSWGAGAIAECYENGMGVERDLDKAIEYYSMDLSRYSKEIERVKKIKQDVFVQKKGKKPMIAAIVAVVIQYVVFVGFAKHPFAFIMSLITAGVVGNFATKKLKQENEKKIMIISAVISVVAGFILPMIDL